MDGILIVLKYCIHSQYYCWNVLIMGCFKIDNITEFAIKCSCAMLITTGYFNCKFPIVYILCRVLYVDYWFGSQLSGVLWYFYSVSLIALQLIMQLQSQKHLWVEIQCRSGAIQILHYITSHLNWSSAICLNSSSYAVHSTGLYFDHVWYISRLRWCGCSVQIYLYETWLWIYSIIPFDHDYTVLTVRILLMSGVVC